MGWTIRPERQKGGNKTKQKQERGEVQFYQSRVHWQLRVFGRGYVHLAHRERGKASGGDTRASGCAFSQKATFLPERHTQAHSHTHTHTLSFCHGISPPISFLVGLHHRRAPPRGTHNVCSPSDSSSHASRSSDIATSLPRSLMHIRMCVCVCVCFDLLLFFFKFTPICICRFFGLNSLHLAFFYVSFYSQRECAKADWSSFFFFFLSHTPPLCHMSTEMRSLTPFPTSSQFFFFSVVYSTA